MGRPARPHSLRPSARSATPHRVLVVDTETQPLGDGRDDVQVLRLWAGRLLRRHDAEPSRPRVEDVRGQTAAELADLVDRLARSGPTLWLMSHNLAFDLAVTELPVHLADRGWRLTDGALTTDHPWLRLARRRQRLVIADTWSWLPTSVAELGERLGVPKPALPDWEDAEDAWYARCERDVAITAGAIEQLLDWWDEHEVGHWAVTGPASGWSAYRSRRPPPHVWIDPDPAARALEHRAVVGGRAEVRKTGRLDTGLVADLDFVTAHLTVMANEPLPARRLTPFDALALDDPILRSPVLDVLAEVEVETDTPRYPWNSGRGIFYPVGRWRTILAGPEIREALRRGELRAIGRGYRYLLSHHMLAWARWLADLLAEDAVNTLPAVGIMAKSWSRSIPGKWCGRTSTIIDRQPDPRPGWAVEQGMLMPARRPVDFVLLGGERMTFGRDEWSDDAFPAVLAWIQSYTRVALGRLIDALGNSVVAANTDGVLVDVDAVLGDEEAPSSRSGSSVTERLQLLDAKLDVLGPLIAPFVTRVKTAARSAVVIGPQHVILGGERRLAGIPRRAVNLGGHRYRFRVWPRLRHQLRPDHLPAFTLEERTVDLGLVPVAGWRRVDGSVEPIAVTLDAEGHVRICPPTPLSATGVELAPMARQHPLLRDRFGEG